MPNCCLARLLGEVSKDVMAGRWREKETGTLTLFGFGLSSRSSTSTVPSEADDTDISCPSAKGRSCKQSSTLKFKPEWKQQFLMWPAASSHSSEDTVDDKMVGVLCNERIKAKCSIGNQHQERKHPKSKVFSEGKRLRILGFYESNLSRQQTTMRHAMEPNQLLKLAPFKLVFIINKHKMPFSTSPAFVEFAALADPNSVVFSQMPSSNVHSNV